jgi:DNA-binding GntR family transcriptional regulator
MLVRRITYDADGVPLESARDLFRGDRTRTVAWTLNGPEDPGT